MRGPRHAKPLDRDTVVRTAADLADRDGWAAVTLSRVARDLHRHVTSMYTHVDSLDALRRDVALLAATEMGDLLWAAALGRSRDDALAAIAHVYRTYPRDHPGRGEALLTYRQRDDDEFVAVTVRMSEPLRATLRSYGLDDRQVEHAHRVFSATLRGFAVGEAVGLYDPHGERARRRAGVGPGRRAPEASRAAADDADTTYDEILDLFTRTLRAGGWPRVGRSTRRRKGA